MVEIEAEREQTRAEIATYLREFANKLEAGEKVTLMVGNESATINPPMTLDFQVEVESDTTLMGTEPENTVTFELEWKGGDVEEDDEMSIQ